MLVVVACSCFSILLRSSLFPPRRSFQCDLFISDTINTLLYRALRSVTDCRTLDGRAQGRVIRFLLVVSKIRVIRAICIEEFIVEVFKILKISLTRSSQLRYCVACIKPSSFRRTFHSADQKCFHHVYNKR